MVKPARRDYAEHRVLVADIIPNFQQGKALDINQAASSATSRR